MGKNLTIERIKENLDFINKNNSESFSIELMCHPGFPSKNFGDEFNKSEERLHEKQILESEEFKELINDYQLINFRELDKNNLTNLTINFLIITDLSPASGNLTQSMRIKKIINRNYNVYMRHSMISNRVDDEFIENESKDIENLLRKEKINCIIGINVWKASRLLYPLLNNNKIETINIPKIMIIAGTDANSAIKVY